MIIHTNQTYYVRFKLLETGHSTVGTEYYFNNGSSIEGTQSVTNNIVDVPITIPLPGYALFATSSNNDFIFSLQICAENDQLSLCGDHSHSIVAAYSPSRHR